MPSFAWMSRPPAPTLDRLHARIAAFDAWTELPTPSPWAIALAVLAVLAFGVFVGRVLTANQGVTTLLAASPRPAATAAPGAPPTAKPPPTAVEATPEPETGAEESSTTTEGPQATKAHTGKGGARENEDTGHGDGSGSSTQTGTVLPPVKHVFLIVLSDEGFNAAFGTGSQAPYLAKTLRSQGELLSNYYAVTSGELANEIALISGQGPNPQTAEDCPVYADLAPATAASEGQALGSGCLFPAATPTLAGQLEAKGKTWRAYVEGVGDSPSAQPPSCRHPAAGATDPDHTPGADGYVTWRDPFVYFHSLIDGRACGNDVVGLDRLATDLHGAATTPALAYVAPGRCDDGSPQPCAPGQPAGLGAADAFLHKVVPEIESSAAYDEGGLIAITFDQAPQAGPGADTGGCCVDGPFPNLPSGTASGTASGAGTGTPPEPSAETTGGGKVGLLLLSKYVKPNSLNAIGEYNHFSLLRSIENLFGLQPLGYAGAPALLAFDKSVYNGKGA